MHRCNVNSKLILVPVVPGPEKSHVSSYCRSTVLSLKQVNNVISFKHEADIPAVFCCWSVFFPAYISSCEKFKFLLKTCHKHEEGFSSVT